MSVRSRKSFSEGGPGGSKKYHVDSLHLGKNAHMRKSNKKTHSKISTGKHSYHDKVERHGTKYTASDFSGGHFARGRAQGKPDRSKSGSHSRSRSRSRSSAHSRSGSKKSKNAYRFENASSSADSPSDSDSDDDGTGEDSDSTAALSIASSHHSSHRRRSREKDRRRSPRKRAASRARDDRQHHSDEKKRASRHRSRSRGRDDDRSRSSSLSDKGHRHRSRSENRDAGDNERDRRSSSRKKPYIINKYNIPLLEAHHGKRPKQAEIRLPREDGEDIFVIGPGVGRHAAARRKKAKEQKRGKSGLPDDHKKYGSHRKRKTTRQSGSGWPRGLGKGFLNLVWKSVKHKM